MLNLVAVGGREIGAHAAVVPRNDHAAPARRLRLVVAVVDLQTGLLVRVLEDLGVLVLADAPNEDDGVCGKDVLLLLISV